MSDGTDVAEAIIAIAIYDAGKKAEEERDAEREKVKLLRNAKARVAELEAQWAALDGLFEWGLTGYDGPNCLKNAECSWWSLKLKKSIEVNGITAPESISGALRKALAKEEQMTEKNDELEELRDRLGTAEKERDEWKSKAFEIEAAQADECENCEFGKVHRDCGELREEVKALRKMLMYAKMNCHATALKEE